MSLLAVRRRERRFHAPANTLEELYRRRERAVDAGISVDSESAARHGAVFGCVDLIARLVSTLPIHEYRRSADGAHVRLPDPKILDQPDGELEVDAWLYAELDSLLKRGNAFGVVQAVEDGWPSQVATVHPNDVTYERKGKRGYVGEWRLDGKRIEKWPAGDLVHIPAYVVAGCPVGMSPIAYAAQTVGVGLAAQRFAAQWFRDGMIPAALLTNEAEVPPELAKLVLERWRDALAGNREPVVLGDGWQYNAVSINPEESQFLDTIGANVADVCRFFGLEPEAIGGTRAGGSSVVYQNVEQSQIHLLVRTIGPWVVRLEKALSRLRPRGRYVKFNVDALLRVDAATRAKVIESQIRTGRLSVNEARALEDRPGIGPDGDRYVWPPMRQQLTETELGSGEQIEGEVDASTNGSPARVPAMNGSGGN